MKAKLIDFDQILRAIDSTLYKPLNHRPHKQILNVVSAQRFS